MNSLFGVVGELGRSEPTIELEALRHRLHRIVRRRGIDGQADLDTAHLANASGADELRSFTKLFPGALLAADLQDAIAARDGVAKDLAFSERHRERLLQIN